MGDAAALQKLEALLVQLRAIVARNKILKELLPADAIADAAAVRDKLLVADGVLLKEVLVGDDGRACPALERAMGWAADARRARDGRRVVYIPDDIASGLVQLVVAGDTRKAIEKKFDDVEMSPDDWRESLALVADIYELVVC